MLVYLIINNQFRKHIKNIFKQFHQNLLGNKGFPCAYTVLIVSNDNSNSWMAYPTYKIPLYALY